MKYYSFGLAFAILVSACSGQPVDGRPPLAATEKATLEYANCVDASARKLAAGKGQTEDLARQALSDCQGLRAEALTLKSVPVIFSSIAKFESTHLGLARDTIESARKKNGRL